MVFRLPTHLETFIPPPSSQSSRSSPWRGSLFVSGLRRSDKGSNQEIRVTAVETDGDNRLADWPVQFFVHPTHGRPILNEVLAWVERDAPPLCTFMPDRLRDANDHTTNQSHFRSLSRILFEQQMVALAYWNTETITGAGIIIYPAQNSSALLVGALLLSSPFPDFVYRNLSAGPSPVSPTGIHPRYQQQTMGSSPPYASPSRPPPHPSSRHIQQHQQPISPPDQPGPSGRSDPYRYIMPRMAPQPYPMSASSSSGNPTWQVIKDEDNSDLSGFSSPPGGSHYPQ